MRISRVSSLFVVAGVAWAVAARAEESMIVYPKAGQSAEKLDQDKAECTVWATKQTGFDPLNPPPPPAATAAAPSEPTSRRGERREARKGGGAAEQAAQADQAAMTAYQADLAAKQDKHRSAMKACLEGRNYSVQ